IARRSAATARRSFHGTYLRLLRTLCTMQSCTWVLGNTASIASGSPWRPSTHAIKQSCTPRFFSSVKTASQNFAPSLSLSHNPQEFFLAVHRDSQREVHRFGLHRPLLARFDKQRIKREDGVHRGERPGLPGAHVLQHRVRNGRDERR